MLKMTLQTWTKAVTVGVGLALLGSTDLTIAQTLSPPSPTVRPSATAITEAEVRAVLNQIIAANRQQDSEGLIKFLAPDVTIDLTVQTIAGSRRVRLTRQQYADSLKQGMAAIDQHQATYSAIKIRIAPDGKTATATYAVQESSRMKNKPITIAVASNQVVIFQRVQGQLQATALKAIARVEVQQVES